MSVRGNAPAGCVGGKSTFWSASCPKRTQPRGRLPRSSRAGWFGSNACSSSGRRPSRSKRCAARCPRGSAARCPAPRSSLAAGLRLHLLLLRHREGQAGAVTSVSSLEAASSFFTGFSAFLQLIEISSRFPAAAALRSTASVLLPPRQQGRRRVLQQQLGQVR
jgi:hypothetical protein